MSEYAISGVSPDAIVGLARSWREAMGRGPELEGAAARQYSATSAYNRYCALSGDFRQAAGQSSIFVEDLVRDTIAEIFMHEFPEAKLVNGGLIPFRTSGHRGQKEFGWNERKRTGVDHASAIVNEAADDVQKVDIEGQRHLQSVHTVARGFEWTIEDLDAFAMQGSDLVAEKAAAAREQLDEDLEDFIANGVPSVGWPALFNYPNSYLGITPTTGSWASATVDQRNADMLLAWSTQFTGTKNVEQGDTVLFSPDIWPTLQKPVGTDYTQSQLSVFRAMMPWITRWDWHRLLPAGSLFMYRNDPRKVGVKAPVRFEFLPPQSRGMKFETIIRNRFGGVFSPAPKSMLLMSGL